MEALGRFGLESPVLLIAQIVNFLVVAWLINRFLLRPLMANLKIRREKIQKGIADAEAAQHALQAASAERDKVLQQASVDAYQLLETARDDAERLRAAALERAGRDADRLIEDARSVMELERQNMEREVQGLSLQLSAKILESAVEGLFSDEEKGRVVARGIQRMRSGGRS
jgi:F-type H+-transporting ATPase subunit b